MKEEKEILILIKGTLLEVKVGAEVKVGERIVKAEIEMKIKREIKTGIEINIEIWKIKVEAIVERSITKEKRKILKIIGMIGKMKKR